MPGNIGSSPWSDSDHCLSSPQARAVTTLESGCEVSRQPSQLLTSHYSTLIINKSLPYHRHQGPLTPGNRQPCLAKVTFEIICCRVRELNPQSLPSPLSDSNSPTIQSLSAKALMFRPTKVDPWAAAWEAQEAYTVPAPLLPLHQS